MPIESRLVDLETRIAYQDETLEQLNGVVIKHQQEIEEMRSLILRLTKNLKQLQEGVADPSDEPPPPHY